VRILIIDDDKEFAEYLCKEFKRYFSYLREKLDTILITENFDKVLSINSPDIVFIDVDLVTHSSIGLAKYIKNAFPNSIFIFMSNYDDLVFSTLSVGIFQFIRKKQAEKDILEVFVLLKDYIANHFQKTIIRIKGVSYVIQLKDIEYVLSIGHDLIIQTNDKSYTISSSVDNFLKQNNYVDFIQIQRTLVINFNYTKSVERGRVVMKNGREYKVGRKYQNGLIERYEEFLLR